VREQPSIAAQTPPARPSAPARVESLGPVGIEASGAKVIPKRRIETKSLDVDQVIADYLKKNEEQSKLNVKVLSPDIFVAGKSIGLRVLVMSGAQAIPDAVVTIKIIGTAFKPQVHIGRAGKDGIANFSLTLPSFNAGTAAIVIESQADQGRGELKHLIRRA
jgi:hypothetical protein